VNVAAVPPTSADTIRSAGDPPDAPAPGFDLLLAGAARAKRAAGGADRRDDRQRPADEAAEPGPPDGRRAEPAAEPDAPVEPGGASPANPALLLAALAIIQATELPIDAAPGTTGPMGEAEQAAAVIDLDAGSPAANTPPAEPVLTPALPAGPVAATDAPATADASPPEDAGAPAPDPGDGAPEPAATIAPAPPERVASVAKELPSAGTPPRAELPEPASDRAREVLAALDQAESVPARRPVTVPAVPAVPGSVPASPASDRAHDVAGALGAPADSRPLVAAAPAPAATVAPAEPRDVPPPVPPPAPAEQLVAVLRPLRLAPDGAYRLGLELRPPELGRVEVRVELRDGVLHASMHAETEHAQHALRDAMAHLRARLESDGIRAGRLTVDDGRGGAAGNSGDRGTSRRDDESLRRSRPQPLPLLDPVVDQHGVDDGLDVRL